MRTVLLLVVLIVGLVFARTHRHQQAEDTPPSPQEAPPTTETEESAYPPTESEGAYPESEPEPESEWAYPESEPEPESESEWAYPESEPEPESEWAYPESESEAEQPPFPEFNASNPEGGFPSDWNSGFNQPEPHHTPPQKCQKDLSHRARKHNLTPSPNKKRNIETL